VSGAFVIRAHTATLDTVCIAPAVTAKNAASPTSFAVLRTLVVKNGFCFTGWIMDNWLSLFFLIGLVTGHVFVNKHLRLQHGIDIRTVT
jgi:hypothetical protein